MDELPPSTLTRSPVNACSAASYDTQSVASSPQSRDLFLQLRRLGPTRCPTFACDIILSTVRDNRSPWLSTSTDIRPTTARITPLRSRPRIPPNTPATLPTRPRNSRISSSDGFPAMLRETMPIISRAVTAVMPQRRVLAMEALTTVRPRATWDRGTRNSRPAVRSNHSPAARRLMALLPSLDTSLISIMRRPRRRTNRLTTLSSTVVLTPCRNRLPCPPIIPRRTPGSAAHNTAMPPSRTSRITPLRISRLTMGLMGLQTFNANRPLHRNDTVSRPRHSMGLHRRKCSLLHPRLVVQIIPTALVSLLTTPIPHPIRSMATRSRIRPAPRLYLFGLLPTTQAPHLLCMLLGRLTQALAPVLFLRDSILADHSHHRTTPRLLLQRSL